MNDVDRFLDHMQFMSAVEACTDKGVTERPPVEGKTYVAFVVHPREPGNVLGVAIAHREGEKFVVDVVKEDITVVECAAVSERYGVSQVTGAYGDESDALVHAVAGAINLLRTGPVA